MEWAGILKALPRLDCTVVLLPNSNIFAKQPAFRLHCRSTPTAIERMFFSPTLLPERPSIEASIHHWGEKLTKRSGPATAWSASLTSPGADLVDLESVDPLAPVDQRLLELAEYVVSLNCLLAFVVP